MANYVKRAWWVTLNSLDGSISFFIILFQKLSSTLYLWDFDLNLKFSVYLWFVQELAPAFFCRSFGIFSRPALNLFWSTTPAHNNGQ